MQASVDVSFPFYPEHVPLQSAFLSGSDHTSMVSEEEVESTNDVLSKSDSPSTCDESIIESITLEDPFGSCGFDSKDVLGEDIDEELYPSSNVTLIQALASLFAWFSSFPGLSKEAFNRLLYLLHTFLLPAGNKLPPSYYKARAMINKKGLFQLRSLIAVSMIVCCFETLHLVKIDINLTQELHGRDSNTFQFKHVYIKCLGTRLCRNIFKATCT